MTNQPRRPLVEALESRQLLSGVTAAIHDGTLFVTGTDSADTVGIYRANDGTTHVGTFTQDSAGGSQAGFKFAPWSYGAVHVDLGGGDDRLDAIGLVAWNGGSVLGGDGSDEILLRAVNVNGDFFLDAGEGDDRVSLVNSTYEGLSVRGGNGDDQLTLGEVKVWNYATLDLGNDHDRLTLASVDVYGWTSLYGGDGRDAITARGTRLHGGANVLDFEWVL